MRNRPTYSLNWKTHAVYCTLQSAKKKSLFIFVFSLSQVPIFIPAVFSFTCFFMVFLSLYSDPINTGIGFAISLTGIPAYYIFIHFERKPKWFQKLSGQRLHECKWQQHKTSEYEILSSYTLMILIMMADRK